MRSELVCSPLVEGFTPPIRNGEVLRRCWLVCYLKLAGGLYRCCPIIIIVIVVYMGDVGGIFIRKDFYCF